MLTNFTSYLSEVFGFFGILAWTLWIATVAVLLRGLSRRQTPGFRTWIMIPLIAILNFAASIAFVGNEVHLMRQDIPLRDDVESWTQLIDLNGCSIFQQLSLIVIILSTSWRVGKLRNHTETHQG